MSETEHDIGSLGPVPSSIGGFQNISNGVVEFGDMLLFRNPDYREWADGLIGASINGGCIEGHEQSVGVYRKIPVAHQGDLDHLPPFQMGDRVENPKDSIGRTKLPFDMMPDTVAAYATLAFLEGNLKYGYYNYRAAGVCASVYRSALQRHVAKWWNGEDCDPTTGVHHLASVIACAGIILDAALCDKLTDDRPPRNLALVKFIDESSETVQKLHELFDDRKPKHYTIKDSDEDED